MLKVNHKELSNLIKEYYKKKLALFCFGAFGIGKSFVVRDTAKEIAKDRKREFVEWNLLSKKEKENVFEYPKKYFCLIDIRMSEQDSSDVKGLPKFSDNSEMIEWRIPFWEKYLTLPNSDGILFLDEFNLGTPIVLSSFYKVLYDRCVNDEKMGDNWLIMGAGNRAEDLAFVHTIPSPLLDRGGCCELVPSDVSNWTLWATQHNIDSRIIAFLNMKESYLHKVDENDNQKDTTERGWERVSRLIKDVKDYKTLSLLCSSAIGEGISKEFVSFCKLEEKMKLEDIIKNPKKLEKIEDISIKYLLVTAVAERYKNKKVPFSKVMEISKIFDKIGNAEFVALLWRLSSSYSGDVFKKDFLASKEERFIEKYGRFLI